MACSANIYSAGCYSREKSDFPSIPEASGLDRGNITPRPHVIAVFLFSGGRSMVWDCTCVDTFAGIRLNRSAMEDGAAAKCTEKRKHRKYTALAESHQFDPTEVETMRVYGGSTGVILRPINRHPVEATDETRKAN